MASKFIDKSAQKQSIFSSKANYARGLFLLFFLLFSPLVLGAESSFLKLSGYLGKEKIAKAMSEVHAFGETATPGFPLLLEINSEGGDLGQVLELAKMIYELKKMKGLKVIVYIRDAAIGPAAVLPFLSDELECSLYASWGDIPLGTEGALPSNVLQSRVRSLIDTQNPQAVLLEVLAGAMSDPSFQGKIAEYHLESKEGMVSPIGQTLVLNQKQLKEMGLVKELLPVEEFEKRHGIQLAHLSLGSELESPPLQESPLVLEKKLESAIPFQPMGPNTVGYLYIGDHESSINQSTWLYVKQALDHYKQTKPILIILELNTPGGEVFAAQKISDALKEIDTQFNIPVVAVINNWAISAGAMLAYSCRFIATVKDGSMGAAEPVFAGEGGKMESASEKVNSAIRADFASRARFFDRNPLIAEAMVDKQMILVLRHGSVVQLENESQMHLTGPDPDIVLSAKGKLLTLNAQQMIDDGVADLLLPPLKLSEVSEEEKKAGEWPASKMLLFHAPFFSSIPNASIHAYQMDWKTQFFVFLATPLISSLLFMGMIIGGYVEMNHPGLSFPGFIAGAALFLIVLSSYSLQLANWLELIMLLIGIALILAEIFVLPTFGLLGVLGIVLFFAGLFGMLLPNLGSVKFEYDTHSLNAAGQYLIERLAWLCGSLVMSAAALFFLSRTLMPSISRFNRFVLSGQEQDASKGFVAGDNPAELPQAGSEAEVFAALRPAGKILSAGRIYDALSSGEFIDSGEKVVIVRLEGSVIFVKRKLRGENR